MARLKQTFEDEKQRLLGEIARVRLEARQEGHERAVSAAYRAAARCGVPSAEFARELRRALLQTTSSPLGLDVESKLNVSTPVDTPRT